MKFLHGTNRRPDVDARFFFSGPPDAFEKGERIMKARKPPDPESRKLVGFFQVPPPDASPEAVDAWVNGVVDEMLRMQKEVTAAKRKQAKRSSKKRR